MKFILLWILYFLKFSNLSDKNINEVILSDFFSCKFSGSLLEDAAEYCPSVFDGFLCWPPTKAGDKVSLPCPEGVRGLDHESKYKQDANNGPMSNGST